MPVLLKRGPCRTSSADCIDIGLVNNMPDGALESTERQFVALLGAAAGKCTVRLSLYSLPDLPRSETSRRYLDSSYCDVVELWSSNLDGLIVTGTEPRAPMLRDEPYWVTLARIADWADDNAVSVVWSCLAAHAAVLHLDGVERHLLADKRFGLFECAKAADHPLTSGVQAGLQIPHSRWNELREDELRSCNYTVLTRSAEAGVDTFIKQRKALSLFFQGHPEYDERALLREYRRDIGRFLKRQRETYPGMPQGYFEETAATELAAFRERALADRREALLDDFPSAVVEGALRPLRGAPAVQIYRNWLSHLVSQRAGRSGGRAPVGAPRFRRAAPSLSSAGAG
ncbi:MAG: hypothetical protein QOG83_3738 [Alphaproteobacteria bacterium]|nr:hypothetical protein [Alphaproteobacteria bacterium]